MQILLYDGSFEGWLCAVFDVYEYKFKDAQIHTKDRFNGNLFAPVHEVRMETAHSERVWQGLQKKLPSESLDAIYRAFLSEEEGMETVLLRYVQYVFASSVSIETDYSHPDVLKVVQTAKKVWREKHRMEAFVRFQKTGDDLYYAVIEPDHHVLPLISRHFEQRYADQRWLIYDARRKQGIFYDGQTVAPVEIHFSEGVQGTSDITAVYDPNEQMYQQLWQQYFKSVNIAARKNTRLHIQHMPRRYWKYLTEKTPTR